MDVTKLPSRMWLKYLAGYLALPSTQAPLYSDIVYNDSFLNHASRIHIDLRKALNKKFDITIDLFSEMLVAKGRDPKTVDSYVKSIHEFEVYSKFIDFKKFDIALAVGFKEYLSQKRNKRTGQNISKSYLQHCTSQVREFFEWLSRQKGYTRYIQHDDAQYFTLTKNNRNRARATEYQEIYTIDEIISTIRKMPSSSLIEMRNKAMISLTLLTTPRISALQTARMGSIKYYRDFDAWAFVQNPNLVDTK